MYIYKSVLREFKFIFVIVFYNLFFVIYDIHENIKKYLTQAYSNIAGEQRTSADSGNVPEIYYTRGRCILNYNITKLYQTRKSNLTRIFLASSRMARNPKHFAILCFSLPLSLSLFRLSQHDLLFHIFSSPISFPYFKSVSLSSRLARRVVF